MTCAERQALLPPQMKNMDVHSAEIRYGDVVVPHPFLAYGAS